MLTSVLCTTNKHHREMTEIIVSEEGLRATSSLRFSCMCVLSHSVVSDSTTPRTVAHQAPLSMGILQARMLKGVAISFSRGSSQPRDRIQVEPIAGTFFTIWATRVHHPPNWRASQVVLVLKNPPAKAGDVRDKSSVPGSGRSSGGGNGLSDFSRLNSRIKMWHQKSHLISSLLEYDLSYVYTKLCFQIIHQKLWSSAKCQHRVGVWKELD